MGVLTDFIVARADEAEAIVRTVAPYQHFPSIDAKGINEEMLGALDAILCSEPRDPSFMAGSLRAQNVEGGPWVFEVPPALVRRLAALGPKQVADIATVWIQAAEFEYDACDLDDLGNCLERMSQISRQAIAERKTLFMWVCL